MIAEWVSQKVARGALRFQMRSELDVRLWPIADQVLAETTLTKSLIPTL